MGEISDLIINGDVCQFCMCELGQGDGYPRMCAGCKRDEGKLPSLEKVKCKVCGKKIKKAGERDHMRAVHQEVPHG